MTSKADDRIDGRPFYLEEVTIEEPGADVKFDKVIVDHQTAAQPTRITADDRDTQSEAPTEQLNDTIDALRAASGNTKRTKVTTLMGAEAHSDDESVDSSTSHFNENPCVIEDFVRNFLLRSSMFRTLEAFQSEWFEKKFTQEAEVGITNEESTIVPNVYAKNELLNDKVVNLTRQCERLKQELDKLKEDYEKLAKERDFHRMHHRRITQEKDKLLNDIKRQTVHYKNYEPTLKELRHKYETAMKEKMLSNLERDRAMAHFDALRENQKFRDDEGAIMSKGGHALGTGFREDRESGKIGPTQNALLQARREVDEAKLREKNAGQYAKESSAAHHPKDSEWPADRRVNPNLSKITSLPKFNHQSLKVDVVVKVSELPASCVALHPAKEIVVTGSDDKAWYLWSVPSHKSRNEAALDTSDEHAETSAGPTGHSPRFAPAELLMSGTGHSDWVSCCDFHPSGNMIATGSGDATVRVWNLQDQCQAHAFTDHQNAIWSINVHSSGDFIASGSMDTTAKIWDLSSLRCRSTLRGHKDSINAVEFLQFSNTLLTASADKTVKLWDARTQLCAHTYNGHLHSINDACFSNRGDKIVSCDSFGIVQLWDVRNSRSSLKERDLGIHAANTVKIHPGGEHIVVGCADGALKVLEGENLEVRTVNVSDMHEDSINGLCMGHEGNSLFTVSGDSTLRIWR